MNALAFSFDSVVMRTIMDENRVWFMAKDVADALDLRDADRFVRNINKKYTSTHKVSTPGGDQTVLCISEQGLYEGLLKSRSMKAEKFQTWVIEDVLPQISKTGAYSSGVAGDVEGVSLKASLRGVEIVARLIDASAALQSDMLTSCLEKFGIQIELLTKPLNTTLSRGLSEMSGAASATKLLLLHGGQYNGRCVTVRRFNRDMIRLGFMEVVLVGEHECKVLSAKGLVFGINAPWHSRPGVTYPQYFVGKFRELLQVVKGA